MRGKKMAQVKRNRKPIPKIIGAALTLIFGQKYDNDTLELNNGRHEIEIDLESTPGRVWVSFNDDDNDIGELPVCGGNVDTVGVMKTENGFIIHANIHSTSRTLRWFASLG